AFTDLLEANVSVVFLFEFCVLSFSIRRLPSSPVFPYTTLFRSEHGIVAATLVHPWNQDVCDEETVIAARDWPELARKLQPVLSGDRKSTRLNSSHDQISYAVFCLKKKSEMSARNSNLYFEDSAT